MSVGRNDPCPCGSGKKYKACCQERDRARAAAAAVVGEEALREAEAQWEAVARGETVWDAEVAPLPIGMGETRESAPALALVVAGGFVVHGGVVPRRPRGLAVEAGPMPELDEALAESLEHVTESRVMSRMTTPAAWAETEASPEALAELHRAAAEFWREEVWDVLGDGPLLFAFPDGSEWAGSLMGGAGVEFGLVLYSDPDDLVGLLESGGDDPEAHFAGMRGCSIGLSLEPRRALTTAMRREVEGAKWPLGAPDRYPQIIGMHLPEWRVTAGYVERMTLALRAVTLAARDEDPEAEIGVRVDSMEPPLSITWPLPDEAQPITAEGPGANPAAALGGWEAVEEVERVEAERLGRLQDWLAHSDDVAPDEIGHDAANARYWADFLGFHALPAGAVTEYDLRLFIYDYYTRKMDAPPETSEALARGLRRVFAFLEEREGIRYPFAERVLDELERLGAWMAEDGELVEALLDQAQFNVYEDLDAREMLHDDEIPGIDEGWPPLMDNHVATLQQELQRRWLLWYDEAVRAGTTDYVELREILSARQREWMTTPHPAFDGRTPAAVVRANRYSEPAED